MIKKVLAGAVLSAIFFGPAALSAGRAITLEARAGYFFPSSADFKSIYGNGPTIGAEASVSLGKILGFWAGLDYFNKTGALTFTQEPTTLRVLPLFAGLRVQAASGGLRPYAAAAAGYFIFNETNVLA